MTYTQTDINLANLIAKYAKESVFYGFSLNWYSVMLKYMIIEADTLSLSCSGYVSQLNCQ